MVHLFFHPEILLLYTTVKKTTYHSIPKKAKSEKKKKKQKKTVHPIFVRDPPSTLQPKFLVRTKAGCYMEAKSPCICP